MGILSKNKYLLVCGILLVGLVFVTVYEPPGRLGTPDFPLLTTSERTYNLADYPHLSNEIIGLYNYFREILFGQGINEFQYIEPSVGGIPMPFGPGGDAGIRYVLAFLTYGMSEMIETTPGYRDPNYYQNVSDRVLQKMEAPKTKEYWNKSSMIYNGKSYYQFVVDHYGVPPGDFEGLKYTNIMYRGHWALMEALYQFLFNDFSKYNGTLTQQLSMFYEEMTNTSFPTYTTPGVPCEPEQLFVQCNTIQSLAFKMYDSCLNTSPTNYYSAAARLLEFELANMTNEDGLFVNGINVTKFVNGNPNYVDDFDSGYTQGWSIAFINAYNQSIAQMFYPKFKSAYVVESLYPGILGEVAYMKEDKNTDPYSTDIMDFAFSLAANGFGVVCAKEMGDYEMRDNILNWVTHYFTPKWEGNEYFLPTPIFEGLQFVFNMIYYWSQLEWVNLGNFTQRRDASFWMQPYIIDVTDPENIFINQAIYDTTNSAFILTCSATNPGNITLTNAAGGTIFSKQTSGWSTQSNGSNLTIMLNGGNYNFVIEF